MMPRYEIAEAKLWHVGAIVRKMRPEHRHAMTALGLDPHRELRAAFQQSAFRKVWLIDGELAALGGVTGSIGASVGIVWLVLASNVTRFPLAIMREARKQLAEIMGSKRELRTAIIGSDEASWRFAAALGFDLSDKPGMLTRAARHSFSALTSEQPDIIIHIDNTTERSVIASYHAGAPRG